MLHNLQQLYIRGADKLRRLRNILSAFISPPWASKALPAGSEDVTDNTSSSSSLLSSAADEREMKNSSLRLVSKLHLRSPRSQSPHCFSSGRPRAAGGRWSHQFSREKGQTTVELTQRKRLTMNALHSLENRARALCPTHKSCVIWGQKRWYGSAHLLKRFIILTLQKQSPWRQKRGCRVSQAPFYARRFSFAYVIGFHLPMSSALCVFIHASECWRNSHSAL